jgi:SAM-dependent methyltransferase
MNSLWGLLKCPECGDALTLDHADSDQPEEGLLRSGCGLWFPVTDGIPRIFVGELRSIYAREHGGFLRRHGLDGGRAGGAVSDETRAKLATRESFGYEWTHFHEMLPEWEENARFYFEPLGAGADALRGKLAFDGGCGKGRHAYHALKAGARLVALDFSRAVDVARANSRELDGERLFVQADLLQPPFAAGAFDVAYSLGVLHHLPDPEAGFRRLVSLARPGGRVLIYLYHALEGEPLKQALLGAVTLARKLTTRLPHRALLPLTTALGYGLYAGVVMPSRLLQRVPQTRAFAEWLPLSSYARYPVRVIVNDQFDRFSAPLERRYRRAEVQAWLDRAGLEDGLILGGAGWRACGTQPG